VPAGDIHSYNETSGSTPATLPRLLSTNGVMTLVAAARPGMGAAVGLYAGDAVLEEMDGLIADVLEKHKIQNGRAKLINTSGAGYRRDGSRNPHSWSIVDERGLAQWLTGYLKTP
jgi:hypothetical protein